MAMINLLRNYQNRNIDICMDGMAQIIKDVIGLKKER